MSQKPSFFQKLSDSFTSIFPFNSSVKELTNISQVPFDKILSPVRYPSNRRLASEAFGKDDDEVKIKRAKLHHDPLSLPSSRIIKPVNQISEKNLYNNNFNDAASDFSDVSVSTSGVSSLHPRSSKRITLGNIDDTPVQPSIKYPRNLNLSQKLLSPASCKPLKYTNDFMSSPARKILEKLDRLTTPITASDRLSSVILKDRCAKNYNNPYARPAPPSIGKKPVPIKAVTVSASTNDLSKSLCGPIRHKQTRVKKLCFADDIDLDSEIDNQMSTIPQLNESTQVNFSNLPMLKKSTSTNTDEFISRPRRESSPTMDFAFSSPATVNDEEYLCVKEKPNAYQFKSLIPKEEIQKYKVISKANYKSNNLWRCETCMKENTDDCSECTNCGNLFKKNKNHMVLLEDNASDDDTRSTVDNKIEEKFNSTDVKEKISFPTKSSTFSFNSATSQPTSFNLGINSSLPSITTTTVAETKPSIGLFTTSNTELKTSVESSQLPFFPFSSPITTSSGDSSKIPTKDTKMPVFDPSVPPPFAFGQLPVSNSVTDTTKSTIPVFGFSLPPTSSEANKCIFGTSTPETSSTCSSSITSSCFDKPAIAVSCPSFSFGKTSNAPIGVSTIPAVSVPAVTVSSTPFSFGKSSALTFGIDKPTAEVSSSASTAFAFGKSSTSSSSIDKTTTNVSSSSYTPLTFNQAATSGFGNMTTGTSSSSTPVTFNQSSTATSAFGKSTTETSSSSSTPFTFGKTNPPTSETSKPLFGLNASTAPITFGKVNPPTSETNKPAFGLTSTSTSNLFGSTSTNPSFGVDKPGISVSLSSTTSNLFGSSSAISTFAADKSGISVSTSSSTSNLFGSSSGISSFGVDKPGFSVSSSSTILNIFNSPSAISTFVADKSCISVSSSSSAPFTFGKASNAPLVDVSKSNSDAAAITQSSPFVFGKPSMTTPIVDSKQSVSASTPASTLFGQNNSTKEVCTPSFVFNQASNATSIKSNTENLAPSSTVFAFGKTPGSTGSTAELNKPTSALPESKTAFPSSMQSVIPTTKSNSSLFSFGDNLKSSSENSTNNLFSANASSATNGGLFGSNQSQPTSSMNSSQSNTNFTGGFSSNIFGTKNPEAAKSLLFGSTAPSMNFNQPISSTGLSGSSMFSTNSAPFGASSGTELFNAQSNSSLQQISSAPISNSSTFSNSSQFGSGSNAFGGPRLFNAQSNNAGGTTNPVFNNNGSVPNAPAFNMPAFNSNAAFDSGALNSGNVFNFNAKSTPSFASNANSIPVSNSNPFEFKSGMTNVATPSHPGQRRLIKGRRQKK